MTLDHYLLQTGNADATALDLVANIETNEQRREALDDAGVVGQAGVNGAQPHLLDQAHDRLPCFSVVTTYQDIAGVGPHADTLNLLGRAQHVLGAVQEALQLYGDALQMYEAVGDRAGQAAALTNIGVVYHGLGQPEQALAFYHQALPIQEAVGNRAGERVIRCNIAIIYRAQGKLAEMVEALRKVIELDERGQHPDLESDRALLHQVEQEWRQSVP